MVLAGQLSAHFPQPMQSFFRIAGREVKNRLTIPFTGFRSAFGTWPIKSIPLSWGMTNGRTLGISRKLNFVQIAAAKAPFHRAFHHTNLHRIYPGLHGKGKVQIIKAVGRQSFQAPQLPAGGGRFLPLPARRQRGQIRAGGFHTGRPASPPKAPFPKRQWYSGFVNPEYSQTGFSPSRSSRSWHEFSAWLYQ